VRHLDGTDYVEKRTPVVRRTKMDANSSETLDREEIRRFSRRVIERYRAPREDVAVLMPCSARKPYSSSRSHGDFRDAIRRRAHEVVLTSPLGVVPRELENVYPAAHYDTPVTGRWNPMEVEFVSDVLAEYLGKNEYDRLIAHVNNEGYADVIESAVEKTESDVEPEYTVPEGKHPTDDSSLEALHDTLHGERGRLREEIDRAYMRGTLQYQFGRDTEIDDVVDIEGRLPRLRALRGEEHLASLTPEYGTAALTIEGARSLGAPRVEIDDFVPEGSVLAPGVVEAEESIRVGDEVLFEGKSAVGVGRARMHGDEMSRASRGVAISVRHTSDV